MSAVTIYAATRLLRNLEDSEEQYSTNNNTESTPITPELIVTRTGGVPTAPASATNDTECTPTATNSPECAPTATNSPECAPTATNSPECAPTAPAHSWRYIAMSAATFTLSALLSHVAIEAILKHGRGRS